MTLEVSSQRAAYFIKWSVISSWKFSILSFNIRPHWWLSCNSAVWHGHCAGVLGDGSIVRKNDGVMVESIPLDKRPPAATCTFGPPDTWGDLYWNVLCWNATGPRVAEQSLMQGSQIKWCMQTGSACHPRWKALAQRYYINKTHAPENVNYLPPAPLDGPRLMAKLGLIWGRWGPV